MTTLPARVAITRDEDPAGPLAQAIRGAGLEPVRCPAVRHLAPLSPAALERAARALGSYDWLLAASARAARAIAAARTRPWPAGLRTAAVGHPTAAALRAAGARSVVVAERSGAAALLRRLADADDWRGRRVLQPRAARGGRELADGLRALGASVDEVVAYRTAPRPPAEIVSRWRCARPDAVVFGSPSAVEALTAAVGRDALAALEAVVAIGPTTAQALLRHGIDPHVSARADFATVASTMRAALAARATLGSES